MVGGWGMGRRRQSCMIARDVYVRTSYRTAGRLLLLSLLLLVVLRCLLKRRIYIPIVIVILYIRHDVYYNEKRECVCVCIPLCCYCCCCYCYCSTRLPCAQCHIVCVRVARPVIRNVISLIPPPPPPPPQQPPRGPRSSSTTVV